MGSLDKDSVIEAGVVGFGLTAMAKESVFEVFPQIRREWLVPLPLLFSTVYLMIKYLSGGKTFRDALLNGILGGIGSMIVYKGMVAAPKMEAAKDAVEDYQRNNEVS